MTQTIIQKSFAPVKKLLPSWIANPLRNVVTAFLTPVLFSYRSGHFRSSFKMAAVTKNGEPIPWYTYPAINFLKYRTYRERTVLEFGGGQSTLWWAKQAQAVVTFEGNESWYNKIKGNMPSNVHLHHVSGKKGDEQVTEINRILESLPYEKYDVIAIDGLYRYEMIDIACRVLSDDGIIICDNAEGYGFYEGFKDRGLGRVDFYGNAPGVILPYCTAFYFRHNSFVFHAENPIHVIAKE